MCGDFVIGDMSADDVGDQIEYTLLSELPEAIA